MEGAIVLHREHDARTFTISSLMRGQYMQDVALAYMAVTAE